MIAKLSVILLLLLLELCLSLTPLLNIAKLDYIIKMQRLTRFKGNLFLKYDCRIVRDTMFTESNGDRRFAPNYLILVTDGRSNNRSLTWHEALATRAQAITILAVN